MIMRGYRRGWSVRSRTRSGGLGQQQTDAFGNPVNCPAGTHYAVGACIELCNQATVADQYACSQRNNATWANSPNVAPSGGTDPITGLPVSLPGYSPSYMSLSQNNSQTQPITNPVQQSTTPVPAAPPHTPLSPHPGPHPGFPPWTLPYWNQGPYWNQVVNPSPVTQSTATGTSATSATSAVSQANGTVVTGTTTVGGWFTDPTQDLISGLPNWALVAMGGAGVLLIAMLAARRR